MITHSKLSQKMKTVAGGYMLYMYNIPLSLLDKKEESFGNEKP